MKREFQMIGYIQMSEHTVLSKLLEQKMQKRNLNLIFKVLNTQMQRA